MGFAAWAGSSSPPSGRRCTGTCRRRGATPSSRSRPRSGAKSTSSSARFPPPPTSRARWSGCLPRRWAAAGSAPSGRPPAASPSTGACPRGRASCWTRGHPSCWRPGSTSPASCAPSSRVRCSTTCAGRIPMQATWWSATAPSRSPPPTWRRGSCGCTWVAESLRSISRSFSRGPARTTAGTCASSRSSRTRWPPWTRWSSWATSSAAAASVEAKVPAWAMPSPPAALRCRRSPSHSRCSCPTPPRACHSWPRNPEGASRSRRW
mmetsp:Transcript_85355/g.242047  ORF Transcript_85355/g.242047 Transcript_85355/m.242047 type:complete len:264 (-) Transcript_85355:766-1557(-)